MAIRIDQIEFDQDGNLVYIHGTAKAKDFKKKKVEVYEVKP